MLKPDLLRAALVAAIPEYGTDPDRLAIFIESGKIATRFAPPNYNFEYRYKLKVILLDYTGHVDVVMLAVLRWIHVHQPDLLQRRDTADAAIAFDAEVMGEAKVDLDLSLDLTEAVRLLPRDDGGLDLEHLPEPTLAVAFDDVPDGTLLQEVYSNGELILPA
ncbi:MAG: phage tail protein [Pseudomonadota bacterium]